MAVSLKILSLGVNWSLTSALALGLNYRHISTDRAGVAWDSDGFKHAPNPVVGVISL